MDDDKKQPIPGRRFYTDGTRIAGYWAIYDKRSDMDTIWVDCPRTYLLCIIRALNKDFK